MQGDDRMGLEKRRTIYMYSGTPFTQRTQLEGHAVRAMYACCGATDYYMETGDQTYWKTLNHLWEDLSQHQMYITGGVGARAAGEAFGEPYELPNAQAYGESCAAIGNMMWNWRMLAASGEAKFADVIERALYNGINSGMSLDGTLVLLPQSAGVRSGVGRDDPQSVVRHDVLPAEPGAHVRVAARIFLQHQQGRRVRAPVRQLDAGLASGQRHCAEDRAEDELSVGRRREDDRHAGAAGGLHDVRAHSRLGEGREGRGERKGCRRARKRGSTWRSSGSGRRAIR